MKYAVSRKTAPCPLLSARSLEQRLEIAVGEKTSHVEIAGDRIFNQFAVTLRELLVSEAEHFTYIPAPSNPFWSQERKQGFTEALALNGRKCIDFNWPKTADSASTRTRH